jgi:hypothetical protein
MSSRYGYSTTPCYNDGFCPLIKYRYNWYIAIIGLTLLCNPLNPTKEGHVCAIFSKRGPYLSQA